MLKTNLLFLHCKENPIYVFLFWELRGLSPSFHIHVSVSHFIYSQDQSTYFPAAELADQSWKYINLSQIYECRNWETEHYNYTLEITVSFLGIHKWEPDIYIGFSPALHFQCVPTFLLNTCLVTPFLSFLFCFVPLHQIPGWHSF